MDLTNLELDDAYGDFWGCQGLRVLWEPSNSEDPEDPNQTEDRRPSKEEKTQEEHEYE